MSQDVYELMWVQKLLEEIDLYEDDILCLYCDNKVSISIAQYPIMQNNMTEQNILKFINKEKLTVIP